MQLDAAQVDDPGEPGRIIDHDLFRGAARRERQRYRSQPRRPLGGRALLIKGLAFGAVDEALEHHRTIPDSGQSARRDRQIIADDVELRELRLPARNRACPGASRGPRVPRSRAARRLLLSPQKKFTPICATSTKTVEHRKGLVAWRMTPFRLIVPLIKNRRSSVPFRLSPGRSRGAWQGAEKRVRDYEWLTDG